jgi:hypothetical protein
LPDSSPPSAQRQRHQRTVTRRSRWGRTLGRMATVLVALSVPILLLELLFRFVGPVVPGEYQTAQLVAVSDKFGRQNMANRAGWKRSNEFSAHVRVNSKGLRGPEVPYAKPEGVARVLVVGDSFTFGAQVDEEQTMTVLLGQHLQQAVDAGSASPRQVETINAGVDGWNTVNELAWLQSEGFQYEPDVVVLMYFTGNDPGENYDTMKAAKRLGVDVDPTAAVPARELRRSLADASVLYAFLESGIIAKLVPAPAMADLTDLDENSDLNMRRSTDVDRHEDGWQLSGELLQRLREACDVQGVRLLVVGIPTVEHVSNADRPPTPIVAIADAARAPVLDLLMPFRGLPEEVRTELYFPKDRHWTPTGHEQAARLVAADLMTRGFLRPGATAR